MDWFGSPSWFTVSQQMKTWMNTKSTETIFLHKTLPRLPRYIHLEIMFNQTAIRVIGQPTTSGNTWIIEGCFLWFKPSSSLVCWEVTQPVLVMLPLSASSTINEGQSYPFFRIIVGLNMIMACIRIWLIVGIWSIFHPAELVEPRVLAMLSVLSN